MEKYDYVLIRLNEDYADNKRGLNYSSYIPRNCYLDFDLVRITNSFHRYEVYLYFPKQKIKLIIYSINITEVKGKAQIQIGLCQRLVITSNNEKIVFGSDLHVEFHNDIPRDLVDNKSHVLLLTELDYFFTSYFTNRIGSDYLYGPIVSPKNIEGCDISSRVHRNEPLRLENDWFSSNEIRNNLEENNGITEIDYVAKQILSKLSTREGQVFQKSIDNMQVTNIAEELRIGSKYVSRIKQTIKNKILDMEDIDTDHKYYFYKKINCFPHKEDSNS